MKNMKLVIRTYSQLSLWSPFREIANWAPEQIIEKMYTIRLMLIVDSLAALYCF